MSSAFADFLTVSGIFGDRDAQFEIRLDLFDAYDAYAHLRFIDSSGKAVVDTGFCVIDTDLQRFAAELEQLERGEKFSATLESCCVKASVTFSVDEKDADYLHVCANIVHETTYDFRGKQRVAEHHSALSGYFITVTYVGDIRRFFQ
jgi:hypothetical protein